MSGHREWREALLLSAAGGSDAERERRLRAHVRDCATCAAELDELWELTTALRALPTPQPSPRLLDRVHRRIDLQMAERADERLNQVLLAFLLVFSWTVTGVTWLAVRLLRGEPLEIWTSLSGVSFGWSAAYFAFAWLGGAAAVVLLGLNYRKTRRIA